MLKFELPLGAVASGWTSDFVAPRVGREHSVIDPTIDCSAYLLPILEKTYCSKYTDSRHTLTHVKPPIRTRNYIFQQLSLFFLLYKISALILLSQRHYQSLVSLNNPFPARTRISIKKKKKKHVRNPY